MTQHNLAALDNNISRANVAVHELDAMQIPKSIAKIVQPTKCQSFQRHFAEFFGMQRQQS